MQDAGSAQPARRRGVTKAAYFSALPPNAMLASLALAYTHFAPIVIRYLQPPKEPESKRSSFNGFLDPALGRNMRSRLHTSVDVD